MMSATDVTAWRGLEPLRRLEGGVRNEVWLARRGSERFAVRRSGRSEAALEWELDLLAHLDMRGVAVPVPVPADDGRLHVGGVTVSRFFDGVAPRDDRDWRRIAESVAAVHECTIGWPQRPGFASARALLTASRGGDVDLDAMPTDATALVRRAWRLVLTGGSECVVHGDLGPRNILVNETALLLLDWDEARVDVPSFDLAGIPDSIVDESILETACLAWEVATCWRAEPDYAVECLAELRQRLT
jgi:Ser/Thr protein kinase RdoA (MazF antagonist)